MNKDTLSKHVQTIVVSCATGALAWVAFSIQELKVEVAVLAVKVDQLEYRTQTANNAYLPRPAPAKKWPPVEIHALPANYSESRFLRK